MTINMLTWRGRGLSLSLLTCPSAAFRCIRAAARCRGSQRLDSAARSDLVVVLMSPVMCCCVWLMLLLLMLNKWGEAAGVSVVVPLWTRQDSSCRRLIALSVSLRDFPQLNPSGCVALCSVSSDDGWKSLRGFPVKSFPDQWSVLNFYLHWSYKQLLSVRGCCSSLQVCDCVKHWRCFLSCAESRETSSCTERVAGRETWHLKNEML